jgi:hypothetical protein
MRHLGDGAGSPWISMNYTIDSYPDQGCQIFLRTTYQNLKKS